MTRPSTSPAREADRWNHIDHDALRRAAHARALGQPWDARSWVPNAGTKLVIDAMNEVKAKHPFIDLLKPEKEAALKILRSIAPKTFASVADALPAFASWARARVTRSAFVLGVEGAEMPRGAEVVHLLGEAINRSGVDTGGGPPSTGLMDRVGQHHRAGRSPASLVSDDQANLGYWSNLILGVDPVEALRQALQEWLLADRSFALDDRDETYRGGRPGRARHRRRDHRPYAPAALDRRAGTRPDLPECRRLGPHDGHPPGVPGLGGLVRAGLQGVTEPGSGACWTRPPSSSGLPAGR